MAAFVENVLAIIAFGESFLGIAEVGEVEIGVLNLCVVAGDSTIGEEGSDVAVEGLCAGVVGLGEEGES